MRNKKMKKFTAVAAALTVAAATLITGIGATLTAKEVSWTVQKPSGAPSLANLNKDMADGTSFTISADGVNGWISSDTNSATVTGGNVTLNAPGMVRIVRGTAQGDLTSNLYLIADSSKAASYKITKNQSNLKKAGDTDTIPITMKDGKDKTITGQITWTSDDVSVATVGETNGKITAVAKAGVANITGKFTDMYGQSQDIHYAAVVGDNVENTLIGPDENGDYFKPTGDKDVYEKVDEDGNSKTPPEFIYDKNGNMSDGSKPDGQEQKLTPITDSMKNTTPSAEDFDNTKEGYLTDDENKAYEDAIKNAGNAGIIKGENGNYYKPVGGSVWEEITFDPTTGAITSKDPQSFVGGTNKTPSPFLPLYEIIAPTDTTLSQPSAEDFDNIYPGYLTNDPEDKNSEYEQWQAAKNKVPATSITLGTPASDTLTVGDTQAAPSVTIEPENATATDVKWTSSNEDVATVDSATGKVTAVGAGTTTITATITNPDGSTVEQSYTLTVNAKAPTYPTDPDQTEWKVVKTQEVAGKTYALVTTTYLQGESVFGSSKTYAGSPLETWMKNWSNNHVYNTSTGTKYLIEAGSTTGTFVTATVPVTGDSTPKDATDGYQYAFALSSAEAAEGIFNSNTARQCKFADGHSLASPSFTTTGGYSIYWLRTPSASYSTSAYYVYYAGYVTDGGGNFTANRFGVRPACWIEVQ